MRGVSCVAVSLQLVNRSVLLLQFLDAFDDDVVVVVVVVVGAADDLNHFCSCSRRKRYCWSFPHRDLFVVSPMQFAMDAVGDVRHTAGRSRRVGVHSGKK